MDRGTGTPRSGDTRIVVHGERDDVAEVQAPASDSEPGAGSVGDTVSRRYTPPTLGGMYPRAGPQNRKPTDRNLVANTEKA